MDNLIKVCLASGEVLYSPPPAQDEGYAVVSWFKTED